MRCEAVTSVLMSTLWAMSMQVWASRRRIMCFMPGTKRGEAESVSTPMPSSRARP